MNSAKKTIPAELKPNCEHTILSEYEEQEYCPAAIEWKCMTERSLPEFEETVLEMLRRTVPQRMSLPGVNMFVGIVPVDEILRSIDTMVDAVRGTPHVLAIPTFRFLPSIYHLWSEVARLNHHVWQRSAESATPLLHLHKNFLCKQGRDWVAAGGLYSEFVAGMGLGNTLNQAGLFRYVNRLVRFHCAGFMHEAPSVNLSSMMPLPLWHTYMYVEAPFAAAILEGAGHELRMRPVRSAGKGRGKAVPMEVSSVGEPVKPDRGVQALKRQRVGEAGPSSSVGRGRGGGQRVVPAMPNYNLISIDKQTFRGLVSDNGDLRSQLREEKAGRVALEEKVVVLNKKVMRAEKDVSNMKSRLSVANSRVSETQRKLSRSSEDAYREAQDWREVRDGLEKVRHDLTWEVEELEAEVARLKGKLEKERKKTELLEGQLAVWESLVDKKKKKKE